MRCVPAISLARRPSSSEAWVNAMAELCDALAWKTLARMIDIDGLDGNGARTPVFRKGEWA